MADFLISDQGTIVLLAPLTDAGQEWVDAHLPKDATTFGPSIVIEHRYIGDILEGIAADGLTLS